MKVLITGASGVVGHGLLRHAPRHFRFAAIGRDPGRLDPSVRSGVEMFLRGDIYREKAGLSPEDLDRLVSFQVDLVIHAAGSVKFDEGKKAETWSANVEGAGHMISLAKYLGGPEFHHVSTAYAPLERNPYEISKLAAEDLVKKSGLPYSIYRPGIVVGDAATQHIDGFNGFYGFLAPFEALTARLKSKMQNGSTAAAVHLPLRVSCGREATLNLVPIDWLCRTLYQLIERGTHGEIYSLTHPRPPQVLETMKAAMSALGIVGIQMGEVFPSVSETEDGFAGFGRMQKSLDQTIGRFRPYLSGEPVFDDSELRKRLGDDYREPAEITEAIIEKLVDFAVKRRFGRKVRVL